MRPDERRACAAAAAREEMTLSAWARRVLRMAAATPAAQVRQLIAALALDTPERGVLLETLSGLLSSAHGSTAALQAERPGFSAALRPREQTQVPADGASTSRRGRGRVG